MMYTSSLIVKIFSTVRQQYSSPSKRSQSCYTRFVEGGKWSKRPSYRGLDVADWSTTSDAATVETIKYTKAYKNHILHLEYVYVVRYFKSCYKRTGQYLFEWHAQSWFSTISSNYRISAVWDLLSFLYPPENSLWNLAVELFMSQWLQADNKSSYRLD